MPGPLMAREFGLSYKYLENLYKLWVQRKAKALNLQLKISPSGALLETGRAYVLIKLL